MKQKLKKKIIKDRLTKDILAFFHMNQGSIDTVSGVSAWVQEDKKKVKDALDSLVGLGILEEDSTGSTKGYCYTRNKHLMKMIEKIIEGND